MNYLAAAVSVGSIINPLFALCATAKVIFRLPHISRAAVLRESICVTEWIELAFIHSHWDCGLMVIHVHLNECLCNGPYYFCIIDEALCSIASGKMF